MATKIDSSLDWAEIEITFSHNARKLKNRKDMDLLIKAVRNQVTELSKLEVEARRNKRPVDKVVIDKVNASIASLEGSLVIAILLG